jgi:predicted membrane-bound mannosyltransferase
MHADEAILADKLGTMLASGVYHYDPSEYHGPVLSYLAWIPARMTGRTSYEALSETLLRIAPAVTGIFLALAPLLLAAVIGARAAMWAAALIAVSPIMVYYSRYFIPEMPLALWTAVLLALLLRRSVTSSALAGAAAALMIATKETAILALTSAGLAYAVALRPRRPDYRAAVLFLATLAVGTSILLAPPWKWGMFVQAAAAYVERGATGGLHSHPWYAYLQWLLGWHYSFTEAPILLLGGSGLFVAGRIQQPATRFLALYTILLLAIYSAIPYKTPWCAVSLLYPLALLAGMTIGALHSRWRSATPILGVIVLVYLYVQAWRASVTYASDPRNPWVYAHTGQGVFTIRDRIEEFARAAADPQDVAVDVYSRANLWPLPWYLRAMPNVRWWRQVVIPGSAAPIVLVSPEMEPELIRKLYEGPPPGERELYMNLFRNSVELRPQVEVRGYVAKSLWDRREQSR